MIESLPLCPGNPDRRIGACQFDIWHLFRDFWCIFQCDWWIRGHFNDWDALSKNMTNIRPDPAHWLESLLWRFYLFSLQFYFLHSCTVKTGNNEKHEKAQIKMHCDCIWWYLHHFRTQMEVQIIKLWWSMCGGHLKIFKGVIKYSIPCNERICQYTSAGYILFPETCLT